jgi:hypothetical protein
MPTSRSCRIEYCPYPAMVAQLHFEAYVGGQEYNDKNGAMELWSFSASSGIATKTNLASNVA